MPAMKYLEILPHPLLRPYVENYWLITIDGAGSGWKEEISVPDGNTSLMFISGQACRIGPDEKTPEGLAEQAVVVGQKSKPARYRFDAGRRLQAFGIRFRPAGLSRFTTVPQAELKDVVARPEQIFRHLPEETEELVALAPDAVRKAELAGRFLLRNLLPQDGRREQAERAAFHLQQCGGDAGLAGLAEKLGLHPRRLERLFNQYIGLSPKAFARVARFNSAIYYRSLHPGRRLTEVAYAAGYFDQMHFIKDFKTFAAYPPKTYFREKGGDFHGYLNRLLEQRFGSFPPGF